MAERQSRRDQMREQFRSYSDTELEKIEKDNSRIPFWERPFFKQLAQIWNLALSLISTITIGRAATRQRIEATEREDRAKRFEREMKAEIAREILNERAGQEPEKGNEQEENKDPVSEPKPDQPQNQEQEVIELKKEELEQIGKDLELTDVQLEGIEQLASFTHRTPEQETLLSHIVELKDINNNINELKQMIDNMTQNLADIAAKKDETLEQDAEIIKAKLESYKSQLADAETAKQEIIEAIHSDLEHTQETSNERREPDQPENEEQAKDDEQGKKQDTKKSYAFQYKIASRGKSGKETIFAQNIKNEMSQEFRDGLIKYLAEKTGIDAKSISISFKEGNNIVSVSLPENRGYEFNLSQYASQYTKYSMGRPDNLKGLDLYIGRLATLYCYKVGAEQQNGNHNIRTGVMPYVNTITDSMKRAQESQTESRTTIGDVTLHFKYEKGETGDGRYTVSASHMEFNKDGKLEPSKERPLNGGQPYLLPQGADEQALKDIVKTIVKECEMHALPEVFNYQGVEHDLGVQAREQMQEMVHASPSEERDCLKVYDNGTGQVITSAAEITDALINSHDMSQVSFSRGDFVLSVKGDTLYLNGHELVDIGAEDMESILDSKFINADPQDLAMEFGGPVVENEGPEANEPQKGQDEPNRDDGQEQR